MKLMLLVFNMMAFGTVFSSAGNVHEMEQVDKKTYGTAVLCDKNAYHLNVTWTPKNIKRSGIITAYLDFTFNADYVSGKLDVEWYIKVAKTDPWILSVGFSQNYKCATLQQTLKSSNFDIKRNPKSCPYKKGDNVNFSLDYETFDDIPSGYNLAVVKLTNPAGHMYFCFNATTYVDAPDWK